MNNKVFLFLAFSAMSLFALKSNAQAPLATGERPDLSWFRKAKFGLFIHWGLYSKLAGQWRGYDYFGSGEWVMHRAKIPAGTYAGIADSFNPVDFNAGKWATIAKESGVRYMVITAKHHEGFSMFDSKVSPFNIVRATPFGKDPMKALAEACRREGIKFGFYYSQFLDWHEPDGGGNNWDFKEKDKNYRRYYREKAIPQLKELLRDYGPLAILWFDMPGGLTMEQTRELVDSLHKLQPHCLFSSRVGYNLGDYKDFGDSQVPVNPIDKAWEAIFTDNDTWGYIARDKDFKSSTQIIRLLADIASKGGNLMLNVGPDGEGNFPPYEVKYLLKTGQWLRKYGEAIYGTTYGLIPRQPWGVTTSKPEKLFLHVFEKPSDNLLVVPFVKAKVSRIVLLGTGKPLDWQKRQEGIQVRLPASLPDTRDAILEVDYSGFQPDYASEKRQTVSRQYSEITIPVAEAAFGGEATSESVTSSHYFGDWKHDNCAVHMKNISDSVTFDLDILQPGDYRIILDYSCSHPSAGQEGMVLLDDQRLYFRTLETGAYDSHKPLMFIRHSVGLVTIDRAGDYTLTIRPCMPLSQELFRLRNLIIQPVQ